MCLAAVEAATEKTVGKATVAKAAEEAVLAKDAKVKSSSLPRQHEHLHHSYCSFFLPENVEGFFAALRGLTESI